MDEVIKLKLSVARATYHQQDDAGKKLLQSLYPDVDLRQGITDRIDGWPAVLTDHAMTQQEFDSKYAHLDDDTIAYEQLKLITESLNEGHVFDWSDKSEAKYTVYFKISSSSGDGFTCNVYGGWCSRSDSDVGSRLCFKSPNLAKHSANTFTAIYKRFFHLASAIS